MKELSLNKDVEIINTLHFKNEGYSSLFEADVKEGDIVYISYFYNGDTYDIQGKLAKIYGEGTNISIRLDYSTQYESKVTIISVDNIIKIVNLNTLNITVDYDKKPVITEWIEKNKWEENYDDDGTYNYKLIMPINFDPYISSVEIRSNVNNYNTINSAYISIKEITDYYILFNATHIPDTDFEVTIKYVDYNEDWELEDLFEYDTDKYDYMSIPVTIRSSDWYKDESSSYYSFAKVNMEEYVLDIRKYAAQFNGDNIHNVKFINYDKDSHVALFSTMNRPAEGVIFELLCKLPKGFIESNMPTE